MVTPTDFLEQQADLLFNNLAGWETRTLERIATKIQRIGKMNLSDVKALNNIAIVKQDMNAILKDLTAVTGKNISEIQRIYGEVINLQHKENRYLYDYRNKPFVPFADNTRLQAITKAYSKVTAKEMINLSNTKALGFMDEIGGFKNMQDSIYNAFGKAVMQVTTGAGDFKTAMRGVIERMGGSGIRVHYKSGVNRRLDTVIRQNLLWGAKQSSIEYNNMIGEELGCDGIEIDFHSNPRPSHEFMQGMQYSLVGKKTVNGKTYESADRALERLNDYGCLHFKTPIILGVSEPSYSDEQLSEMRQKNAEPKTVDGVEKSGYEWTQDMRRLENEARKEKDIINSLKAAGDEEGARQHRQRLRAINKKYNNICSQTGLTPQKERMRVYSGANTTKTANKNTIALENGGVSGIIKEKQTRIIKSTAEKNRLENSLTTTNDLSDYYTVTEAELPEWKKSCGKCTQEEYKQINKHDKPDGSKGGYVRSHRAWEFNAELREGKEHLLDADDKKTLETIRKLCKDNATDRPVILDRFVDSNYLSEYKGFFNQMREDLVDDALDFVNSNMIGTNKTEKSIVSASYGANVLTDRSIHIRLHCPKGTRLFVTKNQRESEVLFHDGLTYEIVSASKEMYKHHSLLTNRYRLVLNVVVKNNGL